MSDLCNPTNGLCPPGAGGSVLGIQPPMPASSSPVPPSSIPFAFQGQEGSPFDSGVTTVDAALLDVEEAFVGLGADGNHVLVEKGDANGDIPVWNGTGFAPLNVCEAIASCPSNIGGDSVLSFSVFLSSTFAMTVSADSGGLPGQQKKATTPTGIIFDVEEVDSHSGWANNTYTVPGGGGGVYIFDASIYLPVVGGYTSERLLTLRIVPLVGQTREILLDFHARDRLFSATPPIGHSFNSVDLAYLSEALQDVPLVLKGTVEVGGILAGDQISLRATVDQLPDATTSAAVQGGSDRLTRFSGVRISS